jgi:hypothetical protein
MKTKVTGAKFRSALGRVGQLFSRVVWLGAVILICSGASAQNMFVSGTNSVGGEIFKFSWDGKQSIFASGLYKPRDMAFDSAGNPFFVDYEIVGGDLPGTGIESAIASSGLQRAGLLCKEKDVCLELRELSAAKLTMSWSCRPRLVY